jgi:tetratricopeptide (TPR) repeat protein
MRQVVQVLPSHPGFRRNLATLLSVAGDFSGAEQEIRALQDLNTDVRATRILGVTQLGQGLVREAAETYQKLSTMGRLGGSWASIALGDLAAYEGRFSDAVRILEQGAAADLAAKNRDGAAMKLVALAHVHLMGSQSRLAAAAAERALQNSTAISIRFLTARIFVETGSVRRARTLADEFLSQLAVEHQAYGKIIEGGIALKNGEARQAIKTLTEANEVLDTWLGHFDLGRAYFSAGANLQADSEFDRCNQRRGEALYLLDEDPTYAYFPVLHYYRGRVREEMKTAGFADAYREYLRIRGQSTEDPLVPEVRKRIGS